MKLYNLNLEKFVDNFRKEKSNVIPFNPNTVDECHSIFGLLQVKDKKELEEYTLEEINTYLQNLEGTFSLISFECGFITQVGRELMRKNSSISRRRIL